MQGKCEKQLSDTVRMLQHKSTELQTTAAALDAERIRGAVLDESLRSEQSRHTATSQLLETTRAELAERSAYCHCNNQNIAMMTIVLRSEDAERFGSSRQYLISNPMTAPMPAMPDDCNAR